MPAVVVCPQCQSRLKITANPSGKPVKCPKCQTRVPAPVVPAAPKPAPVEEPLDVLPAESPPEVNPFANLHEAPASEINPFANLHDEPAAEQPTETGDPFTNLWDDDGTTAGTGTLLGCSKVLLRGRSGMVQRQVHYEIVDPVSGREVGSAREEPSGGAQVMQLFVKKNVMATRWRLCRGRDMLGWVQRSAYLTTPRFELLDPGDRLVGYFESSALAWGTAGKSVWTRFEVYDRDSQPLLQVRRQANPPSLVLQTLDGQQLGRVISEAAYHGKQWQISFGGLKQSFYVIPGPVCAGQPGWELLLLGVALGQNAIFFDLMLNAPFRR